MSDNEIQILSNDTLPSDDAEDHIYSIQQTEVAKSDYTCPVCACTVEPDEEQHICENCHTPHHKDCWEYADGCAIFGCKKGIIRKPTASSELRERIAPVNLSLMRVWNLLFKVHWLTFLVTALGVIFSSAIGTLFGLQALLQTMFPILAMYFADVLSLLIMFTGLAIPLGAMAYMCLLPAAIVMRIHFHTLNLALPQGNSAVAKKVADRIDMPSTVNVVQTLSKILSKAAEVMIVLWAIFTIIFLFVSTPVATMLGAGLFGTLFLRYIMLGLFNKALESRITILMTFQNRLIASAKQSKNQ